MQSVAEEPRGRLRAITGPVLTTLAVLALAALYPIDNSDTFGHLAAGRQIAELGAVPQYDTVSYFRSTPVRYVNYEWLSDRVFFALYASGGSALLHALCFVLLAILACLLVRIAQLRAASLGAWLVPLFVLAGLPAVRFRLSVRPHLFGLVFAALCLLGLTRILQTPRRREQLIWVAVLASAHVLWVNLHGSHLLGLTFVGLAAVSSVFDRARFWPIALLLGLQLLASCASPFGPAILSGAIAHVFDPSYRAVIEEWQAWKSSQSLWLPTILSWQALWICLSLAALRPTREAPRLFEALYALTLLAMAARSLRFYADAVLLTTPLIAIGLARHVETGAWPRTQRRAAWVGGYACALALAIPGCLALPPRMRFGWGEATEGRPVASGLWLEQHLPRARILAAMADAWDLTFTVPKAQVLLDGRTPLYGPAHIRHVQAAWGSAERLRALIDSTGTDVVVAQPVAAEQQPALRALLGFADFRLVAIEAQHCVFARVAPERAALLDASALKTLLPGYDPAWLLAETLDTAAVQHELARLPDHPNVLPYRNWVRGLLALKPLLRAGGRAGVAPPRSPAESVRLEAALAQLRESDRSLSWVQTVSVYHGLAALAACRLDEAADALERARQHGAVREVLFAEQALALATTTAAGRERVREFLAEAQAIPEARSDPWVAQLQTDLAGPAQCASPR
ncbi:MAG: hypothetical protein RL701_2854 [Pseudomonadota bacterium]